MDFHVEHPRFQTKRIIVKTPVFMGKPKLIVDGREFTGLNTPHLVTDDAGESVTLELEGNGLDPVPGLMIDGEPHDLAPPMQWYEWMWVGIPFILIPLGGCIGGGIGGLAIALNVLVFRSSESGFKRWVATFAITATAFAVTLVLATMAQLALVG